MDGRQNVWSPWYLMPKDKPRKVECKFCDNVISYSKDKMLFHLDYQYDGNGKARVTLCSREQLNTLFAQCGNFVLQPLKLNDMEVPAHFSKGGIEDVAIETSNLLMEEKFASTVEGV
jgi:hypothetical protein